MKCKKLNAVLLTAAIAAVPLSGCSSDKSMASTENKDSDGVLELTYYNADTNKDDPWTDPVALAITDATGVKLTTSYPVSDAAEDISLMIADDKYPDIIYSKGFANSLVEAGALIDLTDLIEEYGPNIKKVYGDELKKLRYSADDPAIYQLSSYGVGGSPMKPAGNAQIQWRVLEENGYDYPTTLAEYEQMIKDYLAKHPKTEDGLDHIGLSMCAADWRWMITMGNPSAFIAEGSPDTGEWLVQEDDSVIFKYRSEKVKEYFRWLSRMYDEGILDSEFATQTYEDYIAKIGSGRVIGLTDNSWNYAEGETILKADGKVDLTYAGLPVTLDENTKCASLMYQGLTVGWGIGITKDCKDPVAAIKFIDFMCSDEGMVLRHWGIEGVNYFVDENGHRYRTEEEIQAATTDQDYAPKTGVGFHVTGFPIYGDGVTDPTGSTYTLNSEESIIATYTEAEKKACEAMNVHMLKDIFPQPDEFETPLYSSPATYSMPSELNEIFNILEEIAWPGLVKAISGGQANFDANYDAMLADFEANGVKEAEAMMTEMVKQSASWQEW
ncbi:MAG: extracellular solute-binding protein [Catenibacillus sp.]